MLMNNVLSAAYRHFFTIFCGSTIVTFCSFRHFASKFLEHFWFFSLPLRNDIDFILQFSQAFTSKTTKYFFLLS